MKLQVGFEPTDPVTNRSRWQVRSWLGPTTFGRPHSVDTSPKVGLVRVVTVADRSRSRFIIVTLKRTVAPG